MRRQPPVSPSPPALAWAVRQAVCLGFLVIVGLGALADDVVTTFETANRLYEEGKYRDAAESYATLVNEGQVSANLCFNLGNAWFKAGELGRAIVQYRLAARLAPRDPDIEANLRMARELVRGEPPEAPSLWRRLVRALTMNEWAGLTGICVWGAFALLAVQQFRDVRAAAWRRWSSAWLAGLAVSAAGLLGAWLDQRSATNVVVTVPEAIVRYGPLEVSPQLVVVPDGTELTVLDRKDDWLQVGGLSRGQGWVRTNDVTTIPR